MKENNSIFTVRTILRVLAIICIVVVFCPTFLVSCSGQNMEINVMTAVFGVKMYGEWASYPNPLMLICLILPVVIFVRLFSKKHKNRLDAMIIAICGVIDLIIWFIFKTVVKSAADKNYCTFNTTGWYTLNIISLVFIILLSVIVLIRKLEMDKNLLPVNVGEAQETLNQMSNAVTKIADNISSNVRNRKAMGNDTIGYCGKCGSPIEYGCDFCTSCGTPVPQSMKDEADAERKAATENETDPDSNDMSES